MTKDEAITAVKEVTGMSLPWDDRHYEALQMAIEALNNQFANPGKKVSAEGQDTISRQAAIDTAKRVLGDHEITRTLQTALHILPSAQPEQSSEIQDILDYLDAVLHPIISPEHWNVYSELHDMISTLPSAQPEIICCKECEYGEQDEVGRWYCRSLGCQIGNEDGSGYCADAERRADERSN